MDNNRTERILDVMEMSDEEVMRWSESALRLGRSRKELVQINWDLLYRLIKMAGRGLVSGGLSDG